jgi:hypothetical protein
MGDPRVPSNDHARDIAPKLRQLLAEPSFVTGLEKFGKVLSGRELTRRTFPRLPFRHR